MQTFLATYNDGSQKTIVATGWAEALNEALILPEANEAFALVSLTLCDAGA